jgi:hypothetical protein
MLLFGADGFVLPGLAAVLYFEKKQAIGPKTLNESLILSMNAPGLAS